MALPEYEKSVNKKKYSALETMTDEYWIDGKPIYRKVVDCGALPNATTKQVSTGLSNVSYVDYEIMAISTKNKNYTKLPSVALGDLSNSVAISLTFDTINLITKADYTMFDQVYATIYYTKQ